MVGLWSVAWTLVASGGCMGQVRNATTGRRKLLGKSLSPPERSELGGVLSEQTGAERRWPLLRLLYTVTAYDRKQHVHLVQMMLSAVSMCEGGVWTRVVIYTADTNPYTAAEAAEFADMASSCTGLAGGGLVIEIEEHPASLQLEMTMQHRREVRRRLHQYDVFVYAEDDVHVELRHILAYYARSERLRRAEFGDRYILGWQRFEKTGIGMGARQVMWENGIDSWHAIEIGGELYVTMVNPHAGAWIATRADLIALEAKCNALRVQKTANSFTRVRAAGWNYYLNCGRRKVLPVDDFANFIVHHLPDKNWWQRSECAVLVPDLVAHLRGWLRRFQAGDKSFLCGHWFNSDFCRDEMKVVPAAERKRRFGVQGSCTVWRNLTSGLETVIAPNDKLRAEGAVMRARDMAGRLEIKRQRSDGASQTSRNPP